MKNDLSVIRDIKRREFETVCRNNGLALTIQRRAIFDALASRTDHPTVDQVYEDIRENLKGVSRTTVYRVLETFVSFGIARKINNPESKARFDADTKRHHHLTCVICGKVLDFHDPTLNNLIPIAGTPQEFDILDYSITFHGLCSDCKKSGRRSAKSEHSPSKEQLCSRE
jgi:Fur family peroxide stress response transcriptional regulator